MAKSNRRKSLKLRIAARKQQAEASLARQGKAGAAMASGEVASRAASDANVLRSIFRLGRGAQLNSGQRRELLAALEERIMGVRSRSSIRMKDLGVRNARELAELFVAEFESMKIKPATFAAFAAGKRIKGYQSRVRGTLFHRYVDNFEPLQADLRKVAAAQVKELNDPEVLGYKPNGPKPKPPKLVNAKGEELPPGPIKFTRPRRTTKIRIIKKSGVVEFIDSALTSYSGDGPGRLWAFLVETEIKTSGAARGFSKQIGFAQLRFGADDVDEIQMVVEGFDDVVRVKPQSIIFSPRSIDRNAVTLLGKAQWGRLTKDEQLALSQALRKGDSEFIYEKSDFRIQSTDKGATESFRRITMALRTADLDLLVRGVFPGIP